MSQNTKIPFWRDKKKIGVHLVFWPIIAVFVIFGVERFGNPVGGSAATVNDKPISIVEFRNSLQRMRDFYSQMTQGKFDDEAEKRYRLRETVIQQLVMREVVAQAAQKMGIQVPDQELADTITQIPAFKKDGNFSKLYYEEILKQNRLTPSQFEDGLRTDALVEKTRQLFDQNLLTNPLQAEKQATLKARKINLDYISVSPEQLASKTAVSEAEVAEYLKQKDSAGKIKEYFDLHRRDYSTAEQVKASHILIKAKKGDPTEEKSALKKITQIQGELKGSNFAALAKKYSDDPGSKTKGGELGWFEKGRMVPEFDAAAFSLKVGETSKPVQTDFGYHLIKLEDKKAAKDVTLEKATPEIAKKLIAETKAQKNLNEVEKKMAAQPAEGMKAFMDLDKSAKWQQTGLFSVAEDAIPQIGADDDLIKDVTKLTASTPTLNKVYKVGGKYVVVKFKAQEMVKVPADDPKLDPALKNESKEIFSAWTTKLMDNAKVKVNPQLFGDANTSSAADM